ncbi:MAG: hypothetical protein LRY20_00655 [Acholeplasmataceae bacterium]|nr:hypothetical protein [Acholeplasmataceae bacterium]
MKTSNKKDIQYLKLKNNNQTSIPVFKQSLLNGNLIKDARPSYSENGTGVFFELNNQGADIFSEITTKYKGKALAIVVDGQILSTPVISQIIKNGNCIINGKFSNEEAFNLSVFLKNGSVDANLKIIEEKRLEYKLDKDFKDSILIAIAVAFSLISLNLTSI